jgi:hypothetical protein
MEKFCILKSRSREFQFLFFRTRLRTRPRLYLSVVPTHRIFLTIFLTDSLSYFKRNKFQKDSSYGFYYFIIFIEKHRELKFLNGCRVLTIIYDPSLFEDLFT